MKVSAIKKAKNEAELVDQATNQLLRAIKEKMIKKQGRVDNAKLRKSGFSERFLNRMEEA